MTEFREVAHGEGRAGTWRELAGPPERPEQAGGIATYVLDVPGRFPWRHYFLGVVSLRPIPGCPPPAKQFPAATHEIMVFACDPGHPPEPGKWKFLQPANVIAQFVCTSDEIVAQAARLGVQRVVEGLMPLEYPFSEQVDGLTITHVVDTSGPDAFANAQLTRYWQEALTATVEHLTTGGHT